MIDLTTTSTIDTGNNDNLTFDKLMDAVRFVQSTYPVIFYMVSEHVPTEDGKIVMVGNGGATPFGKDIICHPLQVQGIIDGLSDKYILRPLDNQEWLRRNRKTPYMYFGNKT